MSKCQCCGGPRDLCWMAQDDLWLEVSALGEQGLLCPLCFDQLAWHRGLTLCWTPIVVAPAERRQRLPWKDAA
jgi:hypothetical protein